MASNHPAAFQGAPPEHELDDWVRAAAEILGCSSAVLLLKQDERLVRQTLHGLSPDHSLAEVEAWSGLLREGGSVVISDVPALLARGTAGFDAAARSPALERLRCAPEFPFVAATCLTDGENQPLGVLALLDSARRAECPELRARLERSGRAIANLLELRRLRDARLLKSEAMLISAQRISGVGCWQWDMLKQEITWSDAMYDIFDLPRSHVPLLEDFIERVHPDDREAVAARTRRCFVEGLTEFPEYRIVRPSGEVRYVEASAELEPTSDGKPWRLVGALFDVTERKHAEEERNQLTLKVMHAQKLESLGVLSAGVAHDFNNLLVGILGNGELALADATLRPATRLLLDRIVDAALTAAGLTRQLLAYTGRGHVQMSEVNLSAHVKGIADLLRATISKSIELSLALRDDLPAIRADTDQLQQITMNLIMNAAEAYADAPGRVDVRSFGLALSEPSSHDLCAPSVLGPGDYVVFEVEDHACGMSRATLDRMFEPFFTTKFTGRGLGLSAVIGITRSHRAVLTVDSTPGVGTRFRVHFPALDRPHTGEIALPAGGLEGAALRGRTALVIDDEPRVRQVERSILQGLGMRVIEATNGAEAIALLEAHRSEVDVALLDLVMPGLDPVSTLRGLRALVPTLPVLVQSGYPEEEAARRLRELSGKQQYLAKPFAKQTLIAKLLSLLA